MKTYLLSEVQMQAVMKALDDAFFFSGNVMKDKHITDAQQLLSSIQPSDDVALVDALNEWKSARSGEKIDWTRLANAEHGLVKAHAKQKGGG